MVTLYMAVTADRYELPVVIAEKLEDIAIGLRMDYSYITRAFNKQSMIDKKRYRIINITVEEDNTKDEN